MKTSVIDRNSIKTPTISQRTAKTPTEHTVIITIEDKLDEIVNRLKPIVALWTPAAQEEGVDICIDYWSSFNWGIEEFTTLELALEGAFKLDKSFSIDIEE